MERSRAAVCAILIVMTRAAASGSVIAEPRHIKSKERVRDLGEVYTQPREVKAMLDLIPDAFADIDTRFFEPAAGDGNFLVAILERKIARIDDKHSGIAEFYEFALLRCLASIYAIDISEENVEEARERILGVLTAAAAFNYGNASDAFDSAAREILRTNVLMGDSLRGTDQIVFVEYTALPGGYFQRVRSELEPPQIDLFYEPLAALSTVHYSELGA
jgi:hypothetical protein